MINHTVSVGLIAASVISFAVSVISSLAALANLQGGNREALKAIFLGAFAPPETFTPAGRRHANRALWAGFIAFALFAIYAFSRI